MAEPKIYHVVAPSTFSRRHGPWPERGLSQAEKGRRYWQNSQYMEDQLEPVFQWYRDIAGNKTDPRRRRKGKPHPFGLVPLLLTAAQLRRLRADLPEASILPNRRLRLPKRGRLTSGDPTRVARADQADFWHLDFTGVLEARRRGRVGLGRGVRVAVIDSGIDRLHPEFIDRTIEAVRFDPETGKLLGQGGTDTHGHGTHVASLLAGTQAGISPKAEIVSVCIFPEGGSNIVAFVNALKWLLDPANGPPPHVINLSGGYRRENEKSDAMETVINQVLASGVLLTCAAGNVRDQCPTPGDFEAVLTVGACQKDGQLWKGPGVEGSGSLTLRSIPLVLSPDLLAPGLDVWGAGLGDQFERRTGTSMATPIVSGLAALEIEKRGAKNVAVDQLIDTLMNRADPSPEARKSMRGLAQA
jgi:subtilisin family serine protease